MNDEIFMNEAFKEAKKALKIGEVPVGCIIVYKNKIIARTHNLKEKNKNTLAHAELIAIKKASRKMKNWRLKDCTIYVTLEPCPMCASAIQQSHMNRLVFGTPNTNQTIVRICEKIYEDVTYNKIEITKNIQKEVCSNIINTFFKNKR